MKFKKGKLYRVIKSGDTACNGCILRYEGKEGGLRHARYGGTPIKQGLTCLSPTDKCYEFDRAIDNPDGIKLVEHISMVKFCKKLKKKLDKQRKI